MRAIRAQYFLSFAVMGSLLPYISVYFGERGLDRSQIGYATAAAGVAVILSPVLVTLVADTRLDPRRLMALLFLLAAATLGALAATGGFWATVVAWLLHSVAFVPIMPLQDGINFAAQRQRESAGLPPAAYHKVRVWGTVGYILPSVLLYWFLRRDAVNSGIVLAVGAAFAVLGAINTLWLPAAPTARPPAPEDEERGVPTLEAARALRRRPLFVFCVATFLLTAGVAGYYSYYPIYLVERVGIDRQWIGLISSIGVVLEVGYVLGFGRLERRFGLKAVMVGGVATMAARMTLLAMFTVPLVAVGTQVVHGAMVLVMMIAPPVFLNRHAGEGYRHSIQGVYTVAVTGLGRIAGNLLAGVVAAHSLSAVFAWSAAMCAAAGVLLAVAFAEAKEKKVLGAEC